MKICEVVRMKKKRIIIVGVIVIIAAAFFLFSRFMSRKEDEEDMLLYDGGGSEEVVVDLAVQGHDHILYIRKIKLILDNPTLGDVINAVNSEVGGVDIRLNGSGEITQIGDEQNNEAGRWQILIDNKSVHEDNVWNIPAQDYQGFTFLWE